MLLHFTGTDIDINRIIFMQFRIMCLKTHKFEINLTLCSFFLLKFLKGVPKTHVYRVIRSGEVRVNKGRAAVDTRLALGDVVRVPPVRVPQVEADHENFVVVRLRSHREVETWLSLQEPPTRARGRAR